MASTTTVAVLIPTFNRGDHLHRAIACARAQTWVDLEIIVSDDGSTDGSWESTEHLPEVDPRIRVIRQPTNLGQRENFRYLLDASDAPFVKFLMDDDLLTLDCIERLITPMLADPRIVLSTSKRNPIDSSDNPLPDFGATQLLFAQDTVVDGLDLGNHVLRRNTNCIGEPSTVLFRRSALDGVADALAVGAQQCKYNADIAMWLNILGRGAAFYAAEPLSYFRIHDGQGQNESGATLQGLLEWRGLIDEAQKLGYLRDPVVHGDAWLAYLNAIWWSFDLVKEADRGHLRNAFRDAGERAAACIRLRGEPVAFQLAPAS